MKALFISRLIANVLALLFLVLYFLYNSTTFAVIGYVFLGATVVLAVLHLILRKKRAR